LVTNIFQISFEFSAHRKLSFVVCFQPVVQSVRYRTAG
jgi:hypothetical protein